MLSSAEAKQIFSRRCARPCSRNHRLGGTGKIQPVRRCIETHQGDNDTILWLDARTEETGRSSFERCCHALILPVKASADQSLVQDAPPVQAVLQCLHIRMAEQK